MADEPLSKERIIDAAERVLRKYGLEKATVVDVAKALGVSHGAVYRHFPSKASIREAVAARWLHHVSDSLKDIHQHSDSATKRLRLWFETLIGIKRSKAEEDPELFAIYALLADEAVDVVNHHIRELVHQLGNIVEDGMLTNEFKSGQSLSIAQALFMATAKFHHPSHAKEWKSPEIDREFEVVWNLLLSGFIKKLS